MLGKVKGQTVAWAGPTVGVDVRVVKGVCKRGFKQKTPLGGECGS